MQFGENDIILYPTDTLYGLGVDATSPEMVRKLKELKERGDEKHISIAVSDADMLRQYVEVTPLAERLIETFLPGKLTIVLKPKNLPAELGTEMGEIGIRIPAREEILELIREFGRPITATSANVSGMPTEKTPRAILAQFGDKSHEITQVIDRGELPPSEPSTVVDARGGVPIIIRPGAISEVAIFDAVKWLEPGF